MTTREKVFGFLTEASQAQTRNEFWDKVKAAFDAASEFAVLLHDDGKDPRPFLKEVQREAARAFQSQVPANRPSRDFQT